ncbi:MAG: ABC transporter permease, partial [Dehalobacterium sp.]
MRARESFRSSLKSLIHNKLRSFLTMLGIIIGIFSVIMLTSIGEGIKSQVTAQVESLGANQLYVFPGKIEMGPKKEKSKLGVQQNMFDQSNTTLTYDDVLDLKGKNGIDAVSCIYNGVDWVDKLKIHTSITGVDEDHDIIHQFDLKYGRFFSKDERLNKAHVTVIGAEANKELFNGQNSVGKRFKLNGKNYQVVGVLKYKKPENMGMQNDDLNVKIYLPVTEMIARNEQKNISQITIKATSAEEVNTAEKTIKDTLLKHHKDIDFTVLKQQDMLDTITNI